MVGRKQEMDSNHQCGHSPQNAHFAALQHHHTTFSFAPNGQESQFQQLL